jgi:hypothetical protein
VFALILQVIIKSQWWLTDRIEVRGSLLGFFPSLPDEADFCASMMRMRGRPALTE